jgi:hypothetical protein
LCQCALSWFFNISLIAVVVKRHCELRYFLGIPVNDEEKELGKALGV